MKVCVIGLGPMGLRHVQACQRSERVELSGAFDLRPETADALAGLDPNAQFFGSLDDLLASGPDMVVIATTAPSHADLFEACAEAGVRRFVVEKPLCVSIAEAFRIERIAERTDSRVVVNISRRYSPLYQRLVASYGRGDGLGGARSFHAVLGASGLGCNGTHMLDLGLMFLGGTPETVVAFMDEPTLPNPRGPQFVDPGGVGIVRWADGRRIVLDMGDDLGVQGKYQCFGPFGRITIDEIRRQLDVETRDEGGRTQALSRVGTPLHRQDESFEPPLDMVELSQLAIEDAAGDGPVVCGLAAATLALKLVIGFHVSHAAGNVPIRFDDIETLAADQTYRFT